MVVFEALVVSAGEYHSKEAKCFSVCWDVAGALMKVMMELVDA